ncbi:CLUMA_CG003623, isoform A [Clunio marinus]|uniref:CLUMA_CG003623, isoform A n=1 Tax=Clunio marinus TaxID=568069 RepID=A0A1J1HPK0_9DIPT|nr:CLUMA_CG003623, isoform A [Clunio marinus]
MHVRTFVLIGFHRSLVVDGIDNIRISLFKFYWKHDKFTFKAFQLSCSVTSETSFNSIKSDIGLDKTQKRILIRVISIFQAKNFSSDFSLL